MDSYSTVRFLAKDLPTEYRPMVYSKFLHSLRDGNEYFKLIDKDAYFLSYHTYIDSLLSHPNCFIRLAVLTDDADVVLGWSMFEPEVLHYVYVNKDYRRTGIGTSLLHSGFTSFTHITNDWIKIWPKKYKTAKFNPFK